MRQYLLFTTVFIITLGCSFLGSFFSGGDNCTQGENMTNPRLVAGLEETGSRQKIRITWESGTEMGAQLPTAYYQAVTLNDETDVVNKVQLTGEREITVEFNNLSSYLQDESKVEFILMFPDRRNYISCLHKGMDDIYFLKVSLFFTSNGALDHVDFEQGVWLGPI